MQNVSGSANRYGKLWKCQNVSGDAAQWDNEQPFVQFFEAVKKAEMHRSLAMQCHVFIMSIL